MDVQGRNDPPRVPCITSRDFHKQISLKTIYLHKNFAACREFATVNLLLPRNLLCFTHYMNLLHKGDMGSGQDILSSTSSVPLTIEQLEWMSSIISHPYDVIPYPVLLEFHRNTTKLLVGNSDL